MIKTLWNLVVLVLAMNFLFVAGMFAWLFLGGKLDKDKLHAIREIVFATSQPTTQPVTEAQEEPTTKPSVRLTDILAEAAGRRSEDQVTVAQQGFDAQRAMLDARFRELENQRQLIDQARAELQKLQENVNKGEQTLAARQKQQTAQEEDKGFQDTLEMYKAMPPKQVKSMFQSLPDDVVVRYLQAMEPGKAASVLKEFKTPEETTRAAVILEKMRSAQTAKTE